MNNTYILNSLEHRASQLDDHTPNADKHPSPVSNRQIKWAELDSEDVTRTLSELDPPNFNTIFDSESIFRQVDDTMRQCLTSSRRPQTQAVPPSDNRWKSLSDTNDARGTWQAIGWNGDVGDDRSRDQTRPTDNEFKEHFNKLLSPPDAEPLLIPLPGSCPYIPVTDDPFTNDEIQDAIKSVKPNKSYYTHANLGLAQA